MCPKCKQEMELYNQYWRDEDTAYCKRYVLTFMCRNDKCDIQSIEVRRHGFMWEDLVEPVEPDGGE